MAKGTNKKTFNKSEISKIKLPSVGAWLTNAGKSIGMASMDVIQDVLPATSELAGNIGEYGQSIKDLLKDIKNAKPSEGGMVSKYIDIGKEAITNTKNDLKTGKLYHSMSEMYDEMNDDDFGDIDFGDDFDSDFDSSFESEDGTTTVHTKQTDENGVNVNNVQVNVDIDKKNEIASNIKSQTKVAIDIGDVQTKAIEKSTSSSLSSMSSMSKMLSGYLGSVDSNVTTMVDVVSTMAKNSTVSLRYYEDSMSQFKIISEATVAIRDSLINGNPAGPQNQQKEYSDVMDMFSGSGALDIREYAKLVKKQFGSAIDSNLFTSQIKFMLSDPDQIRAMVAHPLSNMISGMVKGLMKTTLREAASQFDNTLSEFAAAGLTNIAGLGEGGGFLPGLDIIGKTLGISNKLKRDVDKSNYKTGKVDWTGQDKKTLNEVIPYYLRKIYASLSGGREEAFDYTKGVFRTVKDITDEYRKQDERDLIGGLSSVTSEFKEFLSNNVAFTNSRGSEEAINAMNKLLSNLVQNNYFIRKDRNNSFRKSISEITGITDTATLDLLSAFIDNRSNADNMYLFGRGRQESRASMTKKKMQEESGELLTNNMYINNGTTFDQHLNTTKRGTVTGIKRSASPFIDVDKYGKSPVNYLRDISTLLSHGIVVFPSSDVNATRIGGNGNNPTGPDNGVSGRQIIEDREEYERIKSKYEDIKGKLQRNEPIGNLSLADNYEVLLREYQRIEREYNAAKDKYERTRANSVDGVNYTRTANGIRITSAVGQSIRDRYQRQKEAADLRDDRINRENRGVTYSNEEIERQTRKGKIAVDINGTGDSNYAQLSASAKDFIANQNKDDESPSWFTRFTGIKEDKPITQIVNKFTEYLQKPSQILTDFFKKADSFLFKIVFGDDAGPGGSMVKRVADNIRIQFTKVSNWLNDNILEPLKENLFGEKGIITQLKETKVGKAISEKLAKFKNFMLGEKVLMEDGTYQRRGGVFSNLANEFKATGKDLVDTAKTSVADSINAVHNFINPDAAKQQAEGANGNQTATIVKPIDKDRGVKKHTDRIKLYEEEIRKTREAGDSEENKQRLNQLIALKAKAESNLEKAKAKYKERNPESKEKDEGRNKNLTQANANASNVDSMPRYAKGTAKVPRTGAYILSQGETVVSNGDVSGSQKAEANYVAQVKQNETAGEKLKNAVDSFTTDLTNRLRERASQFSDAMFGGDQGQQRKQALQAVSTDLKGKGAKVAANVGFGILTSIFMPWGIVGGAFVGLGRGLLKNSETVKKLLFGDIGEDGKRKGNIISKDIINTIDENKTGIKLGAIAGLASMVGLLPAVWGGTLTYMAAGLATSMAAKSEFIQRWLYGEMGEDGKRKGGGFADKIKSAFGKDYKKLGLDIGLGAGVGIIGSFFLPGGPIVGALIGAATSIAINTEKFKSFFFGDKDPDTGKRKGGLMGKFTDVVITPVVNLVKDAEDKLVGWFEQKILIPIQTSMAAIGEFIYNKINSAVDRVVSIFKGVGTYIGNKIVSATKKFIKPLFDPFIKGLKKIFGFATKLIGNTIAMPFTILGQLGIMADKSNRHTKAKEYNKNTIVNALTFSKKKRARKGLEEDISFKDRIKSFGDFFNRSKRREAVTPGYSENGEKLKDTMKNAREESKAWIAYKSYMRKHGLKDKMVSRKEFDEGKNPEGKVYSKWKTGNRGAVGEAVDRAIQNANIESNRTIVNADRVVVNGGDRKRTAKEAYGKDYEKYVERFKRNHPDEAVPMTEEEYFQKRIQREKDRKEAIQRETEKYKATSKRGKRKNRSNDEGETDNQEQQQSSDDNNQTRAMSARAGTAKVVVRRVRKPRVNPNDVNVDDNIPNHADGIENATTPHLAVINSGETVIPSDDPDAAKKERKFIEYLKRRKKEREEQRMKDSSGFINQFILRYQAHQAERNGKQKEADELKKAQEAGSYETRARLAREEAEKKETKTFREKILESVEGIKNKYQEHMDQFKSVFGSKGKLALLLLAGIPAIKNAFAIIEDTFGYGKTFKEFADNFKVSVKALYDKTIGRMIERIKEAFSDAGGLAAAFQRLKDQVNSFLDIFKPNKDGDNFLQRLLNFFFPKDKKGNNKPNHLTRPKLKAVTRFVTKRFDKTTGAAARKYLKTLKDNKYAARNGGTISGFDDTISGRAADYDLRTKAYEVNKQKAKTELDATKTKVAKAQGDYDNIVNKNLKNSKATNSADKLKELEKSSNAKVTKVGKNAETRIAKSQANLEAYNKKLNKLTNGKNVDDYIKELDALYNETEASFKSVIKVDKAKAKELNQLKHAISSERDQVTYLRDFISGEEKKIAKAKALPEKMAKDADKMLNDARKAYDDLDKASAEMIEAQKKFDNVKKQPGNTMYDRMDKYLEGQEQYKTSSTTFSSTGTKTKKMGKLENKISKLEQKREAATSPRRQKRLDKKIAKKERKLTKVTNKFEKKTNKVANKINKTQVKRNNTTSKFKQKRLDKKISKQQRKLNKKLKRQYGVVDVQGSLSAKAENKFASSINKVEGKRRRTVSKLGNKAAKVYEHPVQELVTNPAKNIGGKVRDVAKSLGENTADFAKNNRVTQFGKRRIDNVKNVASKVSNSKVGTAVKESRFGQGVSRGTNTVKTGVRSGVDATKTKVSNFKARTVDKVTNKVNTTRTNISNRRMNKRFQKLNGMLNDLNEQADLLIQQQENAGFFKRRRLKKKQKKLTKRINKRQRQLSRYTTGGNAANTVDDVADAATSATRVADATSDTARTATRVADAASDTTRTATRVADSASDAARTASNAADTTRTATRVADAASDTTRTATRVADAASDTTRTATRVADSASDAARTASNAADTATSSTRVADAASDTTRTATRVADSASDAARTASNAADTTRTATRVADAASDTTRTATRVDDVADAARSTSKIGKAAQKAKTAVKSGPGKIIELLQKAIDTIFSKFSALLTKSGKGSTKALGAIDKILQKGAKLASKSATFIKNAKTVAAKVVGGLVPIINGVFMGVGIVSGFFDAATLFAVDAKNVDDKMKAISAIWGGLRNTSLGAIFDIFNEFASEILGFNIVREISTLAYNAIADDDEAKILKDAQETVKTRYNTKVKKDYQAFLKDKKNGKARFVKDETTGKRREISLEEYKKLAKSQSFEEYNYQEHHKTAKMKIKTAVKDFGKYSVSDAFSADYWKVDKKGKNGKVKSKEEIAKEKGKKIMQLPITLIKGIIGDGANLLDGVVRSVSTTIKDFGKNSKTALDVKSPTAVFNEAWWTPPKGGGDNKSKEGIETSSLSKIAFYLNRVIMFVPAMVVGLVKGVGDGIANIIAKIRDAFKPISEAGGGFADAFGSIESAKTVVSGSWWTPPKDDKGNPFSAGQRALFYASRVLAFIPGIFIGLFKDVKKGLEPVLEPITDMFSSVKTMISGEMDLDADEPAKVDKLGVNKFLFYGAKALGFLPKVVCGVAKIVGKVVGPIIDVVKKAMVAIGEDLVTSQEIANSSGIISKEYWAYKTEKDEDKYGIGGLRKVIFYTMRIIGMPIHVVLTVIKGVASVVVNLVSGIATIGGYIAGRVIGDVFKSATKGTDYVFSGKFLDPNVKKDDSFGGLKKILFYISRVLVFVPCAVISLVSSLITNFSSIIDYFKGVGDAASVGSTKIKDAKDANYKDGDKYTGLKKFMFMITRTGSIISWVFRTAVDAIGGFFGGIADKAKGVIKKIKGIFGFGDDDTEEVDGGNGEVNFKVKHPKFTYSLAGGNGEGPEMVNGNPYYSQNDPSRKNKSYKVTNGEESMVNETMGDRGCGPTAMAMVASKVKGRIGGNGEGPEMVNGNPYYSQNDPSRKNKSYKVTNGEESMVNETMGDRGCGPTAMAMVASKVKGRMGGNGEGPEMVNGNPYTPENMAALAEQNNYSTNAGTTPGYFTDIGNKLGMNVTPAMATRSNVEAMVGSGQPVILQGKSDKKSSPYTKSGHYVVAVGKDKSGKVIVNDPRGKEHSKAYTMNEVTDGSGLAWAFSDAGNGNVNTNDTFRNVQYVIAGGSGKPKLNWISVVRAVKKAIAAKKAGYSQNRPYLNITVNGKKLEVRRDCSGFVGACLTVYGVKNAGNNVTSKWLSTSSNSNLTNGGFHHMNWCGWNKLKEGDILALDGHTEIFAYNKNGKHYVYNCGSNTSCNNPNPTLSSHSSYTHVWRPNSSGGATVSSSSSSSSSSGGESVGFASALSELASAVTSHFGKVLNGGKSSKGGSSVNLKGGTTEKKVWNFFRGKGFSPQATAGIMGNIYQESKMNPSLVQNNGRGPAAGLFQWENINAYKAGNMREASRFGAMAQRAKKKGKKWTDLGNQLSFAYDEITSKDIANRFAGRTAPSNLSKVGATAIEFKDFKKTKNISMATKQFEAAFERASTPLMNVRIDAAKKYYKKYSGGNGDGGNGDASIGYRPHSINRSNYPSLNSSLGGFGEDDSYMRDTTYKVNSPELPSQKRLNNRMNRSEKLNGEIKQYNDEKVLEALGNISSGIQDSVTELRGTNEGINKFNNKDFSQGQPVIISGNGNTTNNIVPDNKKQVKKAKKKDSTFIDGNYDIAKQIARGLVTI